MSERVTHLLVDDIQSSIKNIIGVYKRNDFRRV